jgi:hypothetical protein
VPERLPPVAEVFSFTKMPSHGGHVSVALLNAGDVRVLASLETDLAEMNIGQSVRLVAVPDPPVLRAEPL